MIYGLLLSAFVFICFLLILLILIQQGKGSMGLGNLGGGAQMLFGGSGGQDIFQKATWVLGMLFMVGSLGLSLMKSRTINNARYNRQANFPMSSAPVVPNQTDTGSDEY